MCSLGVGENIRREWMRDSTGLSLGEEDIYQMWCAVDSTGLGCFIIVRVQLWVTLYI